MLYKLFFVSSVIALSLGDQVNQNKEQRELTATLTRRLLSYGSNNGGTWDKSKSSDKYSGSYSKWSKSKSYDKSKSSSKYGSKSKSKSYDYSKSKSKSMSWSRGHRGYGGNKGGKSKSYDRYSRGYNKGSKSNSKSRSYDKSKSKSMNKRGHKGYGGNKGVSYSRSYNKWSRSKSKSKSRSYDKSKSKSMNKRGRGGYGGNKGYNKWSKSKSKSVSYSRSYNKRSKSKSNSKSRSYDKSKSKSMNKRGHKGYGGNKGGKWSKSKSSDQSKSKSKSMSRGYGGYGGYDNAVVGLYDTCIDGGATMWYLSVMTADGKTWEDIPDQCQPDTICKNSVIPEMLSGVPNDECLEETALELDTLNLVGLRARNLLELESGGENNDALMLFGIARYNGEDGTYWKFKYVVNGNVGDPKYIRFFMDDNDAVTDIIQVDEDGTPN